MAEKPEGHKRGKSSLSILLHREKSAADGKDHDSLTADQNGSSTQQLSSPSNDSSLHSKSPSMNSRRSKRKVAADVAASLPGNSSTPHADTEEQSKEPAESADKPTGNGSQGGSGAVSIEQSVRTFRLFETLRNGETNAISKAIKECSESDASLGTSILHLAIQCAEPQVVDYVLASGGDVDVNARDRDGNTPLHLAAQLGRLPVVRELLDRESVNDAATNYHGQTALDLARTPEIFQQLQLARSLFIDAKTKEIQNLVTEHNYEKLEQVLMEPRVEAAMDVNGLDLPTDAQTTETGGTLMHEAARKKDTSLLQVLLMHGADPFRRDKKGKLPQDVTKDDRTRNIVKKSPAAVMAQRGIQEKAILGHSAGQPSAGEVAVGGKESREIKGYLKKWTNYTTGYKLRWFVLEDGVLSYYKHQDDAGSACRGAINMRIAKLNMDPQDKTRFEIQGKSSVKYHLKANHVVEAKRWFWALNNAIQWAKDEAKEDDRRRTKDAEALKQAKIDQAEKHTNDSQADSASVLSGKGNSKNLAPPSLHPTPTGSKLSLQSSRGADSAPAEEEGSAPSGLESTVLSQPDLSRVSTQATTTAGGEAEDEENPDYASSKEFQSSNKDAFNITAESVRLQLDLLGGIAGALQDAKDKDPTTAISDSSISKALGAYTTAVSSLNSLVTDLLKISKDRDAYWQYRLDRESDARKLWEDTMARVAQEHEELQNKIGETEVRRKRTKKALRDALENTSAATSRPLSQGPSQVQISDAVDVVKEMATNDEQPQLKVAEPETPLQESVVKDIPTLSDSESDDDEEEFFDAVDSGEIEVVMPPTMEKSVAIEDSNSDIREQKQIEISPSYAGYEDPIRESLKMEYDNRPKISLWGILKSMVGKDMTKMTLPVSFNEPTSLLQRVAEDMEYTDLIDIAADRADSLERMVYVAGFAASEYASTVGRIAKPFNPLLGETFEYVRPDKGYRFFVEQVSHHPPVGAAFAESPKWDYYGESAVKSKFYGRSFDINPLGTWFLKLRPATGGEELYTWKKVTSSVVGIITGSPTVDNYGPMEIKNWTTGEVCILDFKPRGWKASSAYQVTGKVMDSEGCPKWSIGGRWNDKIYARHTPGYYDSAALSHGSPKQDPEAPQAFLVWQANTRPSGIPFNLTPFVLTLNGIPDRLRPQLPPTDTRLRPDQRAMEDGEYDLAATEKHRVEEKQRAKRRERDANGEEFEPNWFTRAKCEITGEAYWAYNGQYWKCRKAHDWTACEDIF